MTKAQIINNKALLKWDLEKKKNKKRESTLSDQLKK